MGAIPIGTPESSEQGSNTAIPIPDNLPTNPIVLTESNVQTDGNPVTIPDSVPADPVVLTEPAGESGGSPITIPDSLPADPVVLTDATIIEEGSPIIIPDELPSDPVVLTDSTIIEEGSPITIPTSLPADPTVLTDGLNIPIPKTDGFTIGPVQQIPFINGNRDDFAYDTPFKYYINTNTLGVENISLSGVADLNSMLMGGVTVNTIETSLTNDNTHLPTSGAVYSAIAAVTHGDHTGQVTSSGLVTSLDISAISSQSELLVGLLSTDELLVNDGGLLARMDISVLEAYMQSNLSFTSYTHPNHTGQVTSTGDGTQILDNTAITTQTALTSGLLSSDELLVSDGGVISRMDVSVLQTFMQANLSFGAGVTDHGGLTGLGDDDHATIYYNSTRLNLWIGSAAITTLGTITTGIWTGSVIGEAYTLPAQATHAGDFLTTDGTNTSWGTFTGVTSVTGGYGITSTGGNTPTIALDGTELDIDDLTAFGATSYIMFTAGAVTERVLTSSIPLTYFVNDAGWTTNTGTVTSVSGSGAITSTGGTSPTIGFDGASLPIDGGALLADDYILVVNSGTTGRHLISSIPLGEFNNNEGWGSGVVESITGGYGITVAGTAAIPIIAFDGTELDIDDLTAWGGTPYILFTSGAVSERLLVSTVPLSSMNNDSGWTNNTGTVTNVSASGNENGITLNSSGGNSPNISLGGTLAISNADWSGADLAVLNGGTGLSDIPANRILTGNGTASLTAESVLTFDGTKFKHGSATELGAVLNDVVLQYEGDYDTLASHMYHRIWSRRDANGSTWTTARIHDAISIDSSFGTPGTDTRCWWERDPNSRKQFWGSDANTHMSLDSGGLDVTGSVTADTHFSSSDTVAILSATAGGTVYLRPNGSGSTTGQAYFTTTTSHIYTPLTVTGSIAATGEITAFS